MNQHTQRKIVWIVVMAIMSIFIIVMKVKEKYFPSEIDIIQEEMMKTDFEIIDNTVILYSDGVINSEKVLLQAERMTNLFEDSNYSYTEKITEYGMLNMLKPMISYEDSEIKKTEYVIIHGGFLDMIAATEIGDFDSAQTTVVGYLKTIIEDILKKSPNTKIILMGIPCYDLTGVEEQYNPHDYNLAFEILASSFDNVYYIDLYSATTNKPLVMESTEYRYDYETIKIIYSKIIETINSIENVENDAK